MWIEPRHHRIVGATLEKLRRAAGLTQTELARQLRKPQSFVSAYESGQRRVDLLEFASIVAALAGSPHAVSAEIFNTLQTNLVEKKRKPKR